MGLAGVVEEEYNHEIGGTVEAVIHHHRLVVLRVRFVLEAPRLPKRNLGSGAKAAVGGLDEAVVGEVVAAGAIAVVVVELLALRYRPMEETITF